MKSDCGNCLYYKDNGDAVVEEGYGLCRRFPQHIDTNDGRWCGEYKPDNESQNRRTEKEEET